MWEEKDMYRGSDTRCGECINWKEARSLQASKCGRTSKGSMVQMKKGTDRCLGDNDRRNGRNSIKLEALRLLAFEVCVML